MKLKETIQKFEQGTQYLNIVSAVTEQQLTNSCEAPQANNQYTKAKFVPASGAATRMFKDLYAYLENEKETDFVQHFFKHLKEFAFYSHLEKVLASSQLDTTVKENRLRIVQAVLDAEMQYGDYPKALIDFHDYGNYITNPIEEHIYEAEQYLDENNRNLHFTIANKDARAFQENVAQATANKEKIHVSYSFQEEATNTLAVDLQNKPFLLEDGTLLYRPGGHGALIKNLNQLEEDIIFIKNIDNVCHRTRIADTIQSKKELMGIGIEIKEKIDQYIQDLLADNFDLAEIQQFIENTLNIHSKIEWTAERAFTFLNRPLRICGVVKNQGEPGGGPFVVDNGDYTDLQICETSEINQADAQQLLILENAYYFNPVDLVCFVKNYKGEKFNLLDFVNDSRYFISEKSFAGRPLKALEHPGLWNGAMHHWNTVFVEVPLSTFNPVKTVNDLLKEGHKALKN